MLIHSLVVARCLAIDYRGRWVTYSLLLLVLSTLVEPHCSCYDISAVDGKALCHILQGMLCCTYIFVAVVNLVESYYSYFDKVALGSLVFGHGI